MIDCSKELVKALTTILPTYYELFCDSNTSKPCITYMLNNDTQDKTGDSLGYSKVRYNIKIWGSDLATLNPKCQLVDGKMRELGFTRISANDLIYGSEICKIFVYEGFAREYFIN